MWYVLGVSSITLSASVSLNVNSFQRGNFFKQQKAVIYARTILTFSVLPHRRRSALEVFLPYSKRILKTIPKNIYKTCTGRKPAMANKCFPKRSKFIAGFQHIYPALWRFQKFHLEPFSDIQAFLLRNACASSPAEVHFIITVNITQTRSSVSSAVSIGYVLFIYSRVHILKFQWSLQQLF